MTVNEVLAGTLRLIRRAFDFDPSAAIQSELKAQLADFKAQLEVDPEVVKLLNEIEELAVKSPVLTDDGVEMKDKSLTDLGEEIARGIKDESESASQVP